ncbi:hypothetical protein GCK32_021135 [Trichostrongylus colubriformis]|uniref:Uncharacterized protein n=1 Tax=Trichostrongylus colubriformis TaxID=6319 RepID=A0AAN8G095_TRICO
MWAILLLLVLAAAEGRLLCGMELITTNFMEVYIKLDCGDHLGKLLISFGFLLYPLITKCCRD